MNTTAKRSLLVAAATVAMWALPTGASAQQQPPPIGDPQPPTEPQVPQIPLVPQSPIQLPVPARPAVAPPAGEAPAEQPTGFSGGDLVITDTNPAMYGGSRRMGKIPLYHPVKEGDSLWGICETYYDDPWAWPQLWAYNPKITNPHWIYPGDRVRLLGGSGYQGRRRPSRERIVMRGKLPGTGQTVRLRKLAVVEDKELEKSGRVLGSRESKWMLSRYDEIYVTEGGKFKPEAGRLFSIYRVREALRNEEGDKVGNLVLIVGTARIKRINKGVAATAVIVESFAPAEREDRVGPLRRTYTTMPVKMADRDLEGRIIANLDDTVNVGTDRIVFLDKGRNQGVQIGNRFLVVRRGDGMNAIIPGDEVEDDLKKFPWETFAEVSILDVKKACSMGIVTRALHEVREGDKVRLRRGY